MPCLSKAFFLFRSGLSDILVSEGLLYLFIQVERFNIIISSNCFIIYRIRKCFTQNLCCFKGDAWCLKQIICFLFSNEISRSATCIWVELNFSHFHKSCRADQYESIYHKLSTVVNNRSCDIARQSTRVNRSVFCFAAWGKFSLVAQLILVLWVPISHDRFVGMALSLWSLGSYWSDLQLL
jgi:hypothetical protein